MRNRKKITNLFGLFSVGVNGCFSRFYTFALTTDRAGNPDY